MINVFSLFVADTKIIDRYDFAAPLNILTWEYNLITHNNQKLSIF